MKRGFDPWRASVGVKNASRQRTHGWIGVEVLEQQGERRSELGDRRERPLAAGPGDGEAADVDPAQGEEEHEGCAEDRPPEAHAEAGRGNEHHGQHGQGMPLEKMAFVAPIEGGMRGERREHGKEPEGRGDLAPGGFDQEKQGEGERPQPQTDRGQGHARAPSAPGPRKGKARGIAMEAGQVQEGVREKRRARPAEDEPEEEQGRGRTREETKDARAETVHRLPSGDLRREELARGQDRQGREDRIDARLQAKQVGQAEEGSRPELSPGREQDRESQGDEHQHPELVQGRGGSRRVAADEEGEHQAGGRGQGPPPRAKEAPRHGERAHDAESPARRLGQRDRRGSDLAGDGDPERGETRVVKAMGPQERLEGAPPLEQIDGGRQHLSVVVDVDVEGPQGHDEGHRRQRRQPQADGGSRQIPVLQSDPVGLEALRLPTHAQRDEQEKNHRELRRGHEKHAGLQVGREQREATDRENTQESPATPCLEDPGARGRGQEGDSDRRVLHVLRVAESVGHAARSPVRRHHVGHGHAHRQGHPDGDGRPPHPRSASDKAWTTGPGRASTSGQGQA